MGAGWVKRTNSRVRLLVVLLFCALCGNVCAQELTHTANGMKADVPTEQLRCELIFMSPNIVRVVKYPYPMTEMPVKQSLSVVMLPQQTKIDYNEKDGELAMSTASMRVVFDGSKGAFRFEDLKGNCLLREKKASFEMRQDGDDKGAYKTFQSFDLDKEEAIYGLGQFQNGKMSQRGTSKYLVQGNVEDVVPVMHSVKGYAVFWDNYSPTTFADGEETSFDSEVGECVDYYFMFGGDADGVIAQIRTLTGEVPMFSLWTYGYWQSKERYKTQNEIVGVVDKYRQLGVPLDGIIQDWQYWGNNYLWNAMEFLNPEFPRPQEMMDSIHGKNAHVIISVWASFGPMTKPYRELEAAHALMDFSTWPPSGLDAWPPNMDYPSGVKVYDPYNPEARDIYWKYMDKGLFSYGMDGWWLDSTEPDHVDPVDADLENKTYLGSFRKVRNAFPLMSVSGVYDHQRATTSDKRVFILTRSAFTGQQRYGASVWSGDVNSTWEALRNQIPAGLNFSLTGIPQWNTDIGGFFAGLYNAAWGEGSGTSNPLFRELYVRWMQFGALTPMMRSHGTDVPREIYNFGQKGEPIYDAIEKAIRLRYSLLPYIYSTSWQVSKNQYTFMRALVMDFAEDKRVWDMNDEYMFGNAILVAPVVNAQYTLEAASNANEIEGWNKQNANREEGNVQVDFTEKRQTELYLPEGAQWYDFWTGERHEGGKHLTRETTIDIIPLYIRAGSIVPLGPDVQYATEKPWDNLEICVYPGADGQFTLYEDEFDNYNYERGAYTETPMKWNDSARTLTIDKRSGSYPGMLERRTFTVKLPDGSSKRVDYNGKRINIKI